MKSKINTSFFGQGRQFFILVLVAMITMVKLSAQNPETLHFQTAVRNSDGVLVTNQDIGVRVSIINEDLDVIYKERQTVQSDQFGQISMDIGRGTDQEGAIGDIGSQLTRQKIYIKVELDPNGESFYSIVDYHYINSFPLASHAKYVLKPFEEDPLFDQSLAAGIEQAGITRWDNATRMRQYPGDFVGGGVVFHVDPGGESGLVVSPYDLGENVVWSESPAAVPGATGKSDGYENTAAIVQQQGEGNYAAWVCDTLTLGRKDDWYLPSLDELSLLYDHRYQVNNALGQDGDDQAAVIAAGNYWTSTEKDDVSAFTISNGNTGVTEKDAAASLRAVRKFSGLYDVKSYSWLVLLGPEEESKSNGNVSEIILNTDGDVIIDEDGKRGTVCRTTPGICLPAKITFKLQTEYDPDASEQPEILRGTGDFRICFGGPPKGETLDNISEANMGEFEGVQFRIHPHVDESPVRVYTGSEPHTCTSIWLRYVDPDKRLDDEGNPITGLASDECQGRGNHCGWKRVGLFEDGFGLENREEALVTVIISESEISMSVKDRTWGIDIDYLKRTEEDIEGDVLRFDQVTYMSISHTNTSRGYETIRISDLRIFPLE